MKRTLLAAVAATLIGSPAAMAQTTEAALPSATADITDCGSVVLPWVANANGQKFTGTMLVDLSQNGKISAFKVDQPIDVPSPNGDVKNFKVDGSTARWTSKTGYDYQVKVSAGPSSCKVISLEGKKGPVTLSLKQ